MISTARAIASLTTTTLLASIATAMPAHANDISPAPDRTIGGPSNARLNSPLGVHATPNGRTYISNFGANSIAVFAPGAAGDVPPEREIAGAATTLTTTRYLDVDPAGNVWVANGNNVTAFGPSASGNVAPAANFGAGMGTFGIAVNGGKVFVGGAATIKRFPISASGPASVERTLTGGALTNVRGMDVDAAGRLWVANGAGRNVLAYDRNADGTASPLRSIKGPSTGIQFASDVAVDSAGRIYVVDEISATVRVFAANANGDVAPIKVLGGPGAALSLPAGIDVGPHNAVFVANFNAARVGVYRTLFPVTVTAPSAPRGLRVSGGAKAKKRTVSWKAPAANGNSPVTHYRIVITKGRNVLKVATVSGSRRSFTVKRSALRKGTVKVVVRAKNAKGWSAPVTRTFRVKKK